MMPRPAILAPLVTLLLVNACDNPPSANSSKSDAGASGGSGSNPQLNPIIASTPNTPPRPVDLTTPPTVADADAVQQLAHIRYGMNIGNYMDQPSSPADRTRTQCATNPPLEGAGASGGKLGGWMFEAIKLAGFDHVRLTINWNCHTGHDAGAGANDIDKAWFDRIDWAIAHTLGRDMVMVIDMHNYWDYFNKLPGESAKLVSLWTQIAEHYKDYPKQLYFEILNEPPYGFDDALWGTDLAACIQAIRVTNPYRTIVYGGTDYNKAYTLPRLTTYLPADDKNLIATVHYYSPYCFTHAQSWDCTRYYDGSVTTSTSDLQWPVAYPDEVTPDAGDTMADKNLALLNADFNDAARIGTDIARPLYVGEFGAMGSRNLESRGAYVSAVVQASEQRGMGWAHWGMVNTTFDAWNGTVGWFPPIIAALRPDYVVPSN